ncbi:MAG: protein-disulfide reductase DsbD [Pseudomonadota bacterium]
MISATIRTAFRTSRRPAARILYVLALMLASLPGIAALPGSSSGDDEFLPVREAFRLSLDRDDRAFHLRWLIADGYYLYRERFRFALVDDNGNAITAFAEPEFPKGDMKQDEIFGLVEVYHHEVSVRLPLEKLPPVTTATLKITYQGCAEAGLCYAPETEEWPADFTGMLPAAGGASSAAATAKPAGNDAGALAGFLAEASFPVIVGTFLLLGIALAFTPCVLPMVPILASIIAGEGADISTRRAFFLSLGYVLGMAFTYTLAGVGIGLLGAAFNLNLWLQSPPVLLVFAALFVLLSLSMFGFYELKVPAFIHDRLAARKHSGGDFLPVAMMGAVSALVVSPCVSAPLAGTLMFIGSTGDALLGGAALFALAFGMGIPLLLVGTFEGKLLPRAGAWMHGVKIAFGILLLGVAVILLGRILPGPVTLGLWALLAIGSAVCLGALEPIPPASTGWRWFRKTIGIGFLGWGLAMGAGALAGGDDVLAPLTPFAGGHAGAPAADSGHALFTRVTDSADLASRLAAAKAAGKPVILDFYADWCVACRIMARDVFPRPAVQAALAGYVALQADVTANTEANQALLREYNVPGLPAILFFRPDGSEVAGQRILGEQDETAFLDWLKTRIAPNLQGSG